MLHLTFSRERRLAAIACPAAISAVLAPQPASALTLHWQGANSLCKYQNMWQEVDPTRDSEPTDVLVARDITRACLPALAAEQKFNRLGLWVDCNSGDLIGRRTPYCT